MDLRQFTVMALRVSQCERYNFLGRPERSVPDELLFYRRCFLGSHISEVPRPIAAKLKLFHMIEIWLESPNKV